MGCNCGGSSARATGSQQQNRRSLGSARQPAPTPARQDRTRNAPRLPSNPMTADGFTWKGPPRRDAE